MIPSNNLFNRFLLNQLWSNTPSTLQPRSARHRKHAASDPDTTQSTRPTTRPSTRTHGATSPRSFSSSSSSGSSTDFTGGASCPSALWTPHCSAGTRLGASSSLSYSSDLFWSLASSPTSSRDSTSSTSRRLLRSAPKRTRLPLRKNRLPSIRRSWKLRLRKLLTRKELLRPKLPKLQLAPDLSNRLLHTSRTRPPRETTDSFRQTPDSDHIIA